MRDKLKQIYQKLVIYRKEILIGILYLILIVAPLIFLPNLHVLIILSILNAANIITKGIAM